MGENKKIRNATTYQYNNIKFRSKSEVMVYKELVNANMTPWYENMKICLWSGYGPMIPFYSPSKKTKELELNNSKLRDITYTPDFYLKYKDIHVYIEVKGFANDVYPYKCKLFRKRLEEMYPNKDCMFFEVHTKKDILKTIQLIKDYGDNFKN